ncbi:unnamed protein product, partial [Ectocarpus sp. 6 AP-2014]
MMAIEVSACDTPPRVVSRRCRPPCSTRFGQMGRQRGLWTDGCLVFCRPSEARASTFGTFSCFPGAKNARGCSRCGEEDTQEYMKTLDGCWLDRSLTCSCPT